MKNWITKYWPVLVIVAILVIFFWDRIASAVIPEKSSSNTPSIQRQNIGVNLGTSILEVPDYKPGNPGIPDMWNPSIIGG